MYDYPPPQRSRPQRNWPLMVIILAVLGFVGLAIWWMESRFSAVFAMAVTGSLVGALLISWGVLLNQANTKTTLGNAASFNRDLAMTEKARQLGATICVDVTEVGDFGWMSVSTDPTGATLALWQPKQPQNQG